MLALWLATKSLASCFQVCSNAFHSSWGDFIDVIGISLSPSPRASLLLKKFVVLELLFSSVNLHVTKHASHSLTWLANGKFSLYAVNSSIPLLLFGFPPTEPLWGIPPSQQQGKHGQEMLREKADMTLISIAAQPGQFLWQGWGALGLHSSDKVLQMWWESWL